MIKLINFNKKINKKCLIKNKKIIISFISCKKVMKRIVNFLMFFKTLKMNWYIFQ